MDPNARQQAVEQLKNAGTVLVTTVANPTTDQLAATLGLSQMLKKLGKNVSTIVTSTVPENLKFLNTEKQFTDNLDSLRDFIVSLDKNLADKLRYKVEGDEVRIFITPYRSKISKEDVRFSQGDFNVDACVVIGAKDRTDIDAAVMKQSRVLNETPVVVVNAGNVQSNVGGTQWTDPQASSVSEMMVSVSEALQGGLLDEQISTTLLTGIISATDHFSNPDTSPKVMTMAAQLMAAGANQQSIMQELKSFDPQSANNGSIATQKNEISTEETKIDKTEDKKEEKDTSSEGEGADHNMKISHDSSSDDTAPLAEQKEEPKPAEPTIPQPVAASEPAKPAEPVVTTTPAPAEPVTPVAPAEPVVAPAEDTSASSDPSPLDDARAAVEAAVSNQPTGPLNPAADIGAQPLTSSTPAITPNVPVAPQLDQSAVSTHAVEPSEGMVAPPSETSATIPGAVNPSQLYPTVANPYEPPTE